MSRNKKGGTATAEHTQVFGLKDYYIDRDWQSAMEVRMQENTSCGSENRSNFLNKIVFHVIAGIMC